MKDLRIATVILNVGGDGSEPAAVAPSAVESSIMEKYKDYTLKHVSERQDKPGYIRLLFIFVKE
jgi:hypothetical protein